MNKLMGFYELKALGIPTIKWEEFSEGTKLSEDILWTIRTALLKGNDYNLPRIVGVTAEKAEEEGKKLKKRLKDMGIVIYYPYFVAEKSGTIKVSFNNTIIEAVDKDLWNLITHGLRDITIIIRENDTEIFGNRTFLADDEIQELLKYVRLLRRKYRCDVECGREMHLEWSYAFDSSLDKKPLGHKYLIFYEMRIV